MVFVLFVLWRPITHCATNGCLQGFPQHNIFINPDKTQLNFSVLLSDGRLLQPNVWKGQDGYVGGWVGEGTGQVRGWVGDLRVPQLQQGLGKEAAEVCCCIRMWMKAACTLARCWGLSSGSSYGHSC
jgi:hypothetical protein